MQIYTASQPHFSLPDRPRTVALGLFDGLHPGHRAVLSVASRLSGGRCTVYTFDPDTLDTKAEFSRLCTTDQQHRLLETAGVEELIEVDFAAVKAMTPAEFVDDQLVRVLHAEEVVCGFNYRFGTGASGDVATLAALCERRGIRVTVVPATLIDGEPVHSTAIRRAIVAGDMATARHLQARAYSIEGTVCRGRRLGRRLGMPTANLEIPAGLTVPRYGVYASTVEIGNASYCGVTNIGVHPTVGADPTPVAETWIDGFSGNLYDCPITVYPVAYLRPEETFDSPESLRDQMHRDAQAARAVFSPTGTIRAVLFDYDNTLSYRHEAFRNASDAFLDYWYPALTPEEHARRRDEMIEFNRHDYGMPVGFDGFVQHFLTCWEPVDPAKTERALERLYQWYAVGRLHEDALSTVDDLRARGLRVGVVTNGGAVLQNAKLDASGLRSHLDIAVVSGEEGIHKPDPAPFIRAARRLGVAPEDCLFVGDHPTNDIRGALAAGMHPFWLYTAFDENHPCYGLTIPDGVPTIRTLADLEAVV